MELGTRKSGIGVNPSETPSNVCVMHRGRARAGARSAPSNRLGYIGRGGRRSNTGTDATTDEEGTSNISTRIRSLTFYEAHDRASSSERALTRDLNQVATENMKTELEEIARQLEDAEKKLAVRKEEWRDKLYKLRRALVPSDYTNPDRVLRRTAPTGRQASDTGGPKNLREPFQATVPHYGAHEAATCATPTTRRPQGNDSVATIGSSVECYHTSAEVQGDANAAVDSPTMEPADKKAAWAAWRSRRSDHRDKENEAPGAQTKAAKKKIYIAQPSRELVEAACRKAKEKKRDQLKLKISVPIKEPPATNSSDEQPSKKRKHDLWGL